MTNFRDVNERFREDAWTVYFNSTRLSNRCQHLWMVRKMAVICIRCKTEKQKRLIVATVGRDIAR